MFIVHVLADAPVNIDDENLPQQSLVISLRSTMLRIFLILR